MHLTNEDLRADRTEMQQLLKLLDDNSYVSRYRTCKNGVTVEDIFWTHPDSIKLFNTFPTMLTLDSTYKTSKYRLSLLEMIGVTSTEKIYFIGFAFLGCEKKGQFYLGLRCVSDIVEGPRKVCENYPDLLKYVESTILDQLGNSKGGLCRDWDFGNHMIQNQHNEIHISFGRSITVLEHRFKDNTLYSQLVKLGDSIRMSEVCTHWKRLRFDEDGVMNEDKSNIIILTEWEVIQERFLEANDNIKIHIEKQLRKIVYLETTDMKPLSQPVKTKGAPKKMKSTSNDNSTTQSPSYFEHVEKVFSDSPTPKSKKKSVVKGIRISKPPHTLLPPKIIFIDEMSIFMHKYIE
ncbi:uncharacterized protein LOC127100455 [Lathyrus oleraceus]|uniref:uncharacterized protein LOC127100455 n=1 Tax=Pisum sativum TaxID=3888 RepID=UPI0021D1062D|nr:uncharacterized protein LOC127100455 [Pisum sativum]